MIHLAGAHGKNSTLEWAVATSPKAGETDSGDGYLVRKIRNQVLLAVVDGLGHGAGAAEATRMAISTLKKQSEYSIISLVQTCHEALRHTRGVVLNLAMLDVSSNAMDWIGIGNVEGVLVRANPRAKPLMESTFLRGGVVGYKLPPLLGAVLPIEQGDLLIFATDGIDSDFMQSVIKSDPAERIAERICSRHGKSSDDALVLVARYRGRGNGRE